MSAKLRPILFFEQYGSLGGGQQVLLELVRAARALGRPVEALIPAGPMQALLQELGATVHLVPACNLQQGQKSLRDALYLFIYTLRLLFQFHAPIRRAGYLYVNGNRLLPVALLASVLWRKPAFYHVHLHYQGLERTLLGWVLLTAMTRAVILPSVFIQEKLVAFSQRFADKRVIVLENGLDQRFTSVSYVDRFSRAPLQQLGIVGRVSSEKGQDVLLPLAKAYPELTFHVLGDAAFSDSAYLDSLWQPELPNIIFYGWVQDLPAKINEINLQVCLMPSRVPEAAPLVPLQMSALSCLAVVRRIGALADVAKALELATFELDCELSSILQNLLAEPPAELARRTEASYAAVMQRYSNEAWQQVLREFFANIFSKE